MASVAMEAAKPVARRHGSPVPRLAPYLFLAPFIILFFLFFAYPVGYAFYLSLFKRVGFAPPSYVGLHNYADLFGDDRFLQFHA